VKRCSWSEGNDLYIEYHDKEWGIPVHDDRKHFEFLALESFQAGLSWLTILKKRENFRKAFDGFDPKKVARYNEKRIEKLMKDSGIIRNRMKIQATINNAKRLLEVQKEFGSFDNYIWGFTKGKPKINSWKTMSQIPTTSKLSDEISKDLKDRGFKFVGSTIIYAHLQAIGIVNDHIVTCFRYKDLK
jgi:DNA-3-methyladenine glycosylase I